MSVHKSQKSNDVLNPAIGENTDELLTGEVFETLEDERVHFMPINIQ